MKPSTSYLAFKRLNDVLIGLDKHRTLTTWSLVTAKVKGSKARPAIWTDRARFDRLAENMRGEARKMSAAAGGDIAAIRAQFSSLGQSCKACHDDFKSK